MKMTMGTGMDVRRQRWARYPKLKLEEELNTNKVQTMMRELPEGTRNTTSEAEQQCGQVSSAGKEWCRLRELTGGIRCRKEELPGEK